VNVSDVDAVEEVHAEALRIDLGLQVDGGGGEHPHVDLDLLRAADAAYATLLQRAQQLCLQLGESCADLVHEERAAVRELEQAEALRVCARERAALMAEQLALEQILGDRAAVYGHEAACPRGLR
jgi:hypothetical protein